MTTSRVHQLHAAGQSIWLDYIDRKLVASGELARRIRDDALTGMTSNPTIFEKALAEGGLYDAQIAAAPAAYTPWDVFELVETTDVRAACDVFRGVFEETGGGDGFVSIEVSPGVANDTKATVEEAHRLWTTVARPNVMVKVPGTDSGIPAIRQLIADGINVNITLLFAVEMHEKVIEAYLGGLEARVAAGLPIGGISSVASFFVSRVDTEVDKRLDVLIKNAPEADRARLSGLKGKAAIANAKLAYRLFRKKFSGERWAALASRGARLQRPLWASTSTKNPAYRDTMYVDALIGPDTVNTLPPATIEAFRDHGTVARTVDVGLDEADRALAELAAAGIRLSDVTDTLRVEGVASFQKSFTTLIERLETSRSTLTHKVEVSR